MKTIVPKLHLKATSSLIAGLIIVISSAMLNLYHLASFTYDKLSLSETITKYQLFFNSPWWTSLNHFYGPYFLLLHGLFSLDHHSVFTFRLTSALIGTFSALLLYLSIKHIYKTTIAFLSCLIYISLISVLIISRQSLAISSQLLLIPAWLIAFNLIKKSSKLYSLLLYLCFIGLSFYIPGGIWFGVLLLIFTYKDIWQRLSALNIYRQLIAITTLLIILTPITFRLLRYSSSQAWLELIGYKSINTNLTSTMHHYFVNLYTIISTLFVYSNNKQLITNVGHLAIFPVSISILILVGIIYYGLHLEVQMSKIWFSLLLIGLLLGGFSLITIYSLIPLFIITLSVGLSYLLKKWYQIFPYNPFARHAGVIIISLVTLFVGFYGIRGYFVAYRYSPNSASQYRYKLK